MNKYTIIIAQVCAILLALIVMVLLALDKGGNKADADGVPPEVNTHGLCVVEVAEPEYEMYFTEADVIALAQMLYGEARGCTLLNQQQCVWCVLNRVDDARFPDSIIGVLKQPHQFYGYSDSFPVGMSCMPLQKMYSRDGAWKSRARMWQGSLTVHICGSPATGRQITLGRAIKCPTKRYLM